MDCASRGSIPTPYVRGDLALSHLVFVDDLMIFACASPLVARNINSLLIEFQDRASLGTNYEKKQFSSLTAAAVRELLLLRF